MQIQKMSFDTISKERTLRIDYSYHKYVADIPSDYYTFDDLFYIRKNKVDGENLPDSFFYCEIGNTNGDGEVVPSFLDCNNRTLEQDDLFKKIENGDIISVKENYILLSKIRPNLNKVIRITHCNKELFFTSAFSELEPKILPVILYYCLRKLFHNSIMAISRQGKGYPTLNEKDYVFLKFDKKIIDILCHEEKRITDSIVQIENDIFSLKKTLTPEQSIIDRIFQKELNCDYQTFAKLRKVYIFHTGFNAFSNNPDLRFSVKFHRPSGEFVKQEFAAITEKKIKHFLAEPILLGASISPSDYDENGEYQYLSMATIKNWTYNAEDAGFVSNEYALGKKEKNIRKDDIILARSGEGTIGKLALIENEEDQAIFADFTMRIRLKNYNPQFAYYFMRSRYFQYLIEIYKKGLGNNTNIFPVVIREFPLPDLSLEDQQRIVNEIQDESIKQNEITDKIVSLRQKIDSLIEETIADA